MMREYIRDKKETMLKGAAVLTAGALGFAGCSWLIGDEYPHPVAGRIDAKSVPTLECYRDKYGKHCSWHFYLFVNGCVELPADVERYMEDHGRDPEYGWVDVTQGTWEQQQVGNYIEFRGRHIWERVLADQTDDNHPCPTTE